MVAFVVDTQSCSRERVKIEKALAVELGLCLIAAVLAASAIDSMGSNDINNLPAVSYAITKAELGDVPLDVNDVDDGDINAMSSLSHSGSTTTSSRRQE